MGEGGAKNQFLATLVANLSTVGFGIHLGWMGIQFNLYHSDYCPLPSGAVSFSQLSWVASFLGIGLLVGTIFAGLMADRFGRKYSLLAMAFPEIVCSCFHYFTKKSLDFKITWLTIDFFFSFCFFHRPVSC